MTANAKAEPVAQAAAVPVEPEDPVKKAKKVRRVPDVCSSRFSLATVSPPKPAICAWLVQDAKAAEKAAKKAKAAAKAEANTAAAKAPKATNSKKQALAAEAEDKKVQLLAPGR